MKLFLLMACCLCLVTLQLSGQSTNPKASFSGIVALATDGRAAYLTFGGPGLKWKIKKIEIGAYMLPSLRMQRDAPRPFITPALGGGILLRHKRLVAGIPVYYVAAQQRWFVAGALGIAFGR